MLDAAVAVLDACEDAKPLAGGMSLVPTLKLRLARYSDLVDLERIAALRGIRRDGDSSSSARRRRTAMWRTSEAVRQAIPASGGSGRRIGDPLVRNRGTIGGSIANADPAADYPSSVLGLGATVDHPPARDSRATTSSSACSRPRCSRERSSPRCVFRSRSPAGT